MPEKKKKVIKVPSEGSTEYHLSRVGFFWFLGNSGRTHRDKIWTTFLWVYRDYEVEKYMCKTWEGICLWEASRSLVKLELSLYGRSATREARKQSQRWLRTLLLNSSVSISEMEQLRKFISKGIRWSDLYFRPKILA